MKNPTAIFISILVGLLVLACSSMGGQPDGVNPTQIQVKAGATPVSYPAPNFLKHNDDFRKPTSGSTTMQKSARSKTPRNEPKTIKITFFTDTDGQIYLKYATIDLNGIEGRWKDKYAKTVENFHSGLLTTPFKDGDTLTISTLPSKVRPPGEGNFSELELSGRDAEGHYHKWVTSAGNLYEGSDDINWKLKWWPW